MNFQEKYDGLIQTIEQMIAANRPKAEIINRLCNENHCSKGELASSFRFITNMTLNDYFSYRQSVFQMNHKLQTGCSLESLAAKFDISDASALSKRIKKILKKSPTEITPEYLSTQIPLTFDSLVCQEAFSMNDNLVSNNNSSTHFGVSDKHFKQIQEAIELRSVYNFSDEEAEFAYDLSHKHHTSLESSFEFLDSVRSEVEYQSFSADSSNWLHIATTSDDFPFENLAYLCLEYNLSASNALDDIKFVARYGYSDFSQLPGNFFDIYYSEGNQMLGLPFNTLIAAAKALDANNLDISDFDNIAFDHSYGGDIVSEIQNYHDSDADFLDLNPLDFSF